MVKTFLIISIMLNIFFAGLAWIYRGGMIDAQNHAEIVQEHLTKLGDARMDNYTSDYDYLTTGNKED